MSKYEPLKRHLAEKMESEIPMTFREMEAILGFRLPSSARSYPAWWSNSVGTHVNAAAWREAGWLTSRVDIGGERVTFVRERGTERPAKTEEGAGDRLMLSLEAMAPSTLRMIDDLAEEAGLDRAGAVLAVLDASAMARRRQLVESMVVARMPLGHDSTALIREDRDGR
ncbi:hypothetical protein [Phenylobacterium sp.]|uniref:DUF7662 domain-containing protein n=1 Tax=Phenylobacterium sp. TaxID=1871053 RepID=UPI0025DEBEAF|nr:hypothetical protein [Phenylobacterium sp.]